MSSAYISLDSRHGTRVNANSMSEIVFDVRSLGGQSLDYDHVELRNFLYPNIDYNILDDSAQLGIFNNEIAFSVDGTDYSGTIQEGFYSGTQLATILTLEMNSIAGVTGYVAYYLANGKFAIGCSGCTAFNIDFSGTNTPWLEMGFQQQLYSGQTAASPTILYYLSPCVAQLQGSSNIFVYIQELASADCITYKSTPITFMIPITLTLSGVQTWSYQVSGPKHAIRLARNQAIRQMTVKLYIERNGVLFPLVGDLNSCYNLTLKFCNY